MKMDANEYETTLREAENLDGIRWRRSGQLDSPISPSEEEEHIRFANMNSIAPSEGFYETIEDLPDSSESQSGMDQNRKAKMVINLSLINNLA